MSAANPRAQLVAQLAETQQSLAALYAVQGITTLPSVPQLAADLDTAIDQADAWVRGVLAQLGAPGLPPIRQPGQS